MDASSRKLYWHQLRSERSCSPDHPAFPALPLVTPSDKAQCIQETTTGGTSSYVELLTCLEMASDARKASTK
jgi:hypothetical protein